MTTRISPVAPARRRPDTPLAHERTATRIVVATLGALIGLAGIEHGIGELLQGSAAPDGIAILSWPRADAFRIVGGEPALTIVPNLLVTGILATLISATFVVWATVLPPDARGGLVLLLLAAAMLPFGGGVAPPLVGLLLGAAATRIDAPLAWWRTHLPRGARAVLGRLWPWALGVDLLAFLLLFPGSVIVGALVAADNPSPVAPGVVYAVILAAFGFLLLAIIAGLAHDSLRQEPRRERSMS